MKFLFAGTVLAAAPLVFPALQGTIHPTPLPLSIPQRSLLGNGGFESWSLGALTQGSIGPDLWYANGATSNFFGQAAIAFTRVSEDPACSSGAPWAAEVRANLPGSFVSQRLEDFAGLADQWVTLSVDLRTPFSVANPRIEINDGVSSSSTTELVGMGRTRLTVQHQVSQCATQLEFRIYPDQTVQANNAMAVVGRMSEARYVPRRNVEPGLMEMPLGGVVDWYRFNVNMPVPEGFAICDGSLVSDPDSPLFELATPNLANKFVRGVTSVGAIGMSGGADSAAATHSHTATCGASDSNGFNFWIQNGGAGRPALDDHRHHITVNSTAITVPTIPSYVGLLKIIRIK